MWHIDPSNNTSFGRTVKTHQTNIRYSCVFVVCYFSNQLTNQVILHAGEARTLKRLQKVGVEIYYEIEIMLVSLSLTLFFW